jgi:CheY-like chemotaxis protein
MARVPTVAQTDPSSRPFIVVARKLAVTGRCCASCGSVEIRPSNRRNALDILLACLFLAPFRCRVCRGRFYRVWRPSLQHPPEFPASPLSKLPSQHNFLNLDVIEEPRIQADPVSRQPSHLEPIPAEIESVAIQLEPPVEAALEAPPPPPAAAPGPILIFESDVSIRKLLRRLLERRGYITVEIVRAVDLGAELGARPADLLIVDISTPESSIDTVVSLARAHPNLKVLALSAEKLTDLEIHERLLVLPKPFALDRFVDCVDRLLQRPGASSAGP